MESQRKRMPAAERREQLLDCLLHVFATDGAHAVSIDRVARDSGVARTVVYAQFPSLEAMVDALATRSERQALQRIAALIQVAADDGSPGSTDAITPERLLEALRGLFADLAVEPDLWRMIFAAPEGLPPVFGSRLATGREQVVSLLEPAIARTLDRLGLPSLDAELTTRMLQAMIREGVRLHLADPDAYPVERLVGQFDALVAALHGP